MKAESLWDCCSKVINTTTEHKEVSAPTCVYVDLHSMFKRMMKDFLGV